MAKLWIEMEKPLVGTGFALAGGISNLFRLIFELPVGNPSRDFEWVGKSLQLREEVSLNI